MKENVILLEEINNLRKEVKNLVHKIKQVEIGGDPLNQTKRSNMDMSMRSMDKEPLNDI